MIYDRHIANIVEGVGKTEHDKSSSTLASAA